MRYLYSSLCCLILFLSAKFISGFMCGFLGTCRYTDVVVFVLGTIYGEIYYQMYLYYENKKDNK